MMNTKMDALLSSTQKVLVEINSFMNKWERLLVSQLEALKNLEQTNEQLEDTVLDVLLVMHQHDLIQSVAKCDCSPSKAKTPRKRKNG